MYIQELQIYRTIHNSNNAFFAFHFTLKNYTRWTWPLINKISLFVLKIIISRFHRWEASRREAWHVDFFKKSSEWSWCLFFILGSSVRDSINDYIGLLSRPNLCPIFGAPFSSWWFYKTNLSRGWFPNHFINWPHHTCSLHSSCMSNFIFPAKSFTDNPRALSLVYQALNFDGVIVKLSGKLRPSKLHAIRFFTGSSSTTCSAHAMTGFHLHTTTRESRLRKLGFAALSRS
jgi:hypothetical protein